MFRRPTGRKVLFLVIAWVSPQRHHTLITSLSNYYRVCFLLSALLWNLFLFLTRLPTVVQGIRCIYLYCSYTPFKNHDSTLEAPLVAGCGCAGANSLEQRPRCERLGSMLQPTTHTYTHTHTNRDIKAAKSQVLFMFCFYESAYSVFILDETLKMVGLLTAVR